MEKFRNAILKARRDHPILFPVGFIGAFGAVCLLALMAYDDLTRVEPAASAYPPSVETQLRLALASTHVRPDPDVAADAYRRALEEAEKVGMDLYGKEVLGIRIKLAEMLEHFGRVKGALQVLKGIATDCEEKVRDMDRGLVLKQRLGPGNELKTNTTANEEPSNIDVRKHLLRQVIQCQVKAADLCTGDYIQDPQQAKAMLSQAMKLLVEESKEARTKGFQEDNGAGLTMDEIAAILAQTGDLYSTTDDAATAVQIYQMALDPLRKACNGRPSCREAQLLSNISGAMAMALKDPNAKVNGKRVTRESLKVARKTAMAWASQAANVASSVDPQERDSICVMGQLSAALNIAGMQLDDGAIEEAKKTYGEVLPVLRQIGLSDMAQAAEAGLKKADEMTNAMKRR